MIRDLENQPKTLPSLTMLSKPEIQSTITTRVAEEYRPSQLEMEAMTKPPDIALIPHDIIAENMTITGLVAHAMAR